MCLSSSSNTVCCCVWGTVTAHQEILSCLPRDTTILAWWRLMHGHWTHFASYPRNSFLPREIVCAWSCADDSIHMALFISTTTLSSLSARSRIWTQIFGPSSLGFTLSFGLQVDWSLGARVTSMSVWPGTELWIKSPRFTRWLWQRWQDLGKAPSCILASVFPSFTWEDWIYCAISDFLRACCVLRVLQALRL